jgi:hypothetical protein
MASGRLAAGKPADASWWLGVLNGNGHRNKLTSDVSRLKIDDPQGEATD